jgi:hypothetical protein
MDALSKTNLILAGLAVGLGLPTFLVLHADANQFTNLDTVPKLFEGFTADNVGRVLVAMPKPGQEAPKPDAKGQKKPVERDILEFVRTDKGWVLGSPMGQPPQPLQGAPVMAQRIEQELLKSLESIRYDKQTLIAKDASDEELAKRDLTEEKAYVIQAMDKTGMQTVADLLVGRDASDPSMGAEMVRGVFARKSDSKDIVLYEVPMFRRSIKADEWIDKKVWQIEASKAVRLKIRSPATNGEELVFEKKPGSDSTWTATKAPPETGALRQQKIEELLQRCQYVQAGEFRRPLQGTNLAELGLLPVPKVEVTITIKEKEGEAEKNYRFATGNPVQDKTNEVYFSAGDSPFLMTWQSYMVQPFEQNPKDWFDPPPGAVQEPKPGENVPGKEEGKKDEVRQPAEAVKPPGDGKKTEEPKKPEDAKKGG